MAQEGYSDRDAVFSGRSALSLLFPETAWSRLPVYSHVNGRYKTPMPSHPEVLAPALIGSAFFFDFFGEFRRLA